MASDELRPMRGGELLVAREVQQGSDQAPIAADPDDPDRGTWVGTIDGTIVGYGTGHVEPVAAGNGPAGGADHAGLARLGVIDELFVEVDARSVGVGEAMMDAMLAWFTARGCTGVDALALPGHRAVKNFFEESGFTARLLVMHRQLDG